MGDRNNHAQPVLLQLADTFDDILGRAVRLFRPVAHLTDQSDLAELYEGATAYQRQLERMAVAASLARSLIDNGLPDSRDAVVYRRITGAVRK